MFEDFVNYKKPSMFLVTCNCDWKCCSEAGISHDACQNSQIIESHIREHSDDSIYKAYIGNTISQAIVIGGLEPMLQFEEVKALIKKFRDNGCNDEFVIYTGYNKDEIEDKIEILKKFGNIICKFGRFVPGQEKHFDDVLGVYLASPNQRAERIS